MPTFKDISGLTFGNVFVKERAPNYRMNDRTTLVMWKCKCLICGNEFVARGNNIKSGNTTSCGCTNKEKISKAQLHDLTGNRYGHITVISRTEDHVLPSGNHKTAWVCLCDCGKSFVTTSEHLTSGYTTSCGCYAIKYRSERYTEDLSGQRFGYLTVLERATTPGKRVKWKCLCDCGNECVITASSLKRKATQSCGCKTFSLGSESLASYLNKNNVKYKTEYRFDDLYTGNKHYLRFDFALVDDADKLIALIEYQGQQHFEERINPTFGKRQREVTDNMKRKYCMEHNIKLFEIRFDDDVDKRLNEILQQLNLIHVNPVPNRL